MADITDDPLGRGMYYWDYDKWVEWDATVTATISSLPEVTGPVTDDELRAKEINVKIVEENDFPDYGGLIDLRYAMDKSNNMPLYTEVANPEKRDGNQAVVASDCPTPILFNSVTVASEPLIVDTIGYNSIVIHSLTAGIITPTTSHDQRNWLGMVGYTATAPKTLITTCAAAGVHVFPCTGRFVKLTGPASLVNAIVYLRNMTTVPLSTIGTVDSVGRVNQWNGTDIVNAGLAGVLAIGGNVATGLAPTTNPLQIGGVDAGRLNTPGMAAANLAAKTRRALVDEQGRFIPPNVDLLLNGISNIQGTATANVRDVNQHEGQSLIEILAKVLTELRVLNHQIHELPQILSFKDITSSDELDELRRFVMGSTYNVCN